MDKHDTSRSDAPDAPAKSVRFGIGAKLLSAFVAISCFTVLAAFVAWILFNGVRDNLSLIADENLPEVAASYRLAEQSAQLSTSIPALVNAQSEAELSDKSKAIAQRLKAIESLVIGHEFHGNGASKTEHDFQPIIVQIRTVFDQLQSAVRSHISSARKREQALQALFNDQDDFISKLEPIISSQRDEMVASTQRNVATGLSRTSSLIDDSFEALRGVLLIEAKVNQLTSIMYQVAATNVLRLLNDRRFAVVGPIAEMKNAFDQLPSSGIARQLSESALAIVGLAIEEENIFELRQALLNANSQARKQLQAKLNNRLSILNETNASFNKLAEQVINDVDFRILLAANDALKEGQGVVAKTKAGIDRFETVLLLNSEVNQIFSVLSEAGVAIFTDDIEILNNRYDRLLSVVERRLSNYEDGGTDSEIRKAIAPILAYGTGKNSLFATRLQELESEQHATQLEQQSQDLVSQLGQSVQTLVENVERSAQSAAVGTRKSLARGELLLLLISAASLIAAILIAWFYVRDIVKRLMGLSSSMLAIAQGDLETGIPSQINNDEIADMAVALSNFREDAVRRRVAEQALRESEQRLRSILEISPIGVVIVRDSDAKVMYGNARMAEQFGTNEEDLVGKRMAKLYVDPRQRDEWLERATRDGFVRDTEVHMKRLDGNDFWALLSSFPIQYANEPARVNWFYDITRRRQAEHEIRAAKTAAEQALSELKRAQQNLVHAEKMASLGQLTAGIAHEIKNPLNFVNNFSDTSVELLEELSDTLGQVKDDFDENVREEVDEHIGLLSSDLGKISHHGKRADRIIRSMLLHARGDQGEFQDVGINDLIEEAQALAYHGERARDKSFNLEIVKRLDPNAGQLRLVPQEITRVLVNILSNAFYALKERAKRNAEIGYSPQVEITSVASDNDIEIRIRDNGLGIPEDVQNNLFTPFFTTKPTGEGTGLGLSMSYDIITQQHGGTLTLNSEPGLFTEFIIHLPRIANGAFQ